VRICCADRPIILDGELAFVCAHRDPHCVMDLFGYWILDAHAAQGRPLGFARLRPLERSVLARIIDCEEYATRRKDERVNA